MEKIIINDAESRYDRWPEAFRKGYVLVDEYSPEDLMAFAVEFSGLINYFNFEDRVDGDWMGFFVTDKALLYAYIAATDIGRIEEEFAATIDHARIASHFHIKFRLLTEVFGQILFQARLFNLFLKIVNRQPVVETTELKQELLEIIRSSLSPELRKLRAYAEGAAARHALDKKIDLPFQEFLPVWNIHGVSPDEHIYGGRTLNQKIDCALTFLQPVYDAFIYQLIFLKQFAASLLPDALAGPHKPHVALYLSFLKLFGQARDSLNTLTPRLRDFYYTEILRQQQRGGIPDKVFLCLVLSGDEGVANSLVKKGALFLAGSDESGQEILYAADHDLWVSPAEITNVYTIHTQYRPLIGSDGEPENQDCGCTPVPIPMQVNSGIFSGDYWRKDAGGGPDAVPHALPENGFPTMGSGAIDAYNGYAEVGFTVASDTLLLAGGHRSLHFSFLLTAASGQIISEYLTELYKATGRIPVLLFQYILENAFTIYLTTADGWMQVEKYEVAILPDPHASPDEANDIPILWESFNISLTLPFSAPAITPLTNEQTGESEGLPMAKFMLRQLRLVLPEAPLAYISPIGLVRDMRVRQISIDAEVKGLSQLALCNDQGEVDTSSPFHPFGSVPVKGSWLQISGGELFSKEISSLQIGVGWFGLPTNKDGFKGYYKYYKLDADGNDLLPRINNESFRVKISTVNPGSWKIGIPDSAGNADGEERSLFSNPLSPTTLFGSLPVRPHTIPDYYSPSDSSIKIELNHPSYAFGNDLYAINLMNAVINDLPRPENCEEECAKICMGNPDCMKLCMEECLKPKELRLPNQPYTPSAAFLSLGYSCSAVLSFGPGSPSPRFYHNYPFGGYQSMASEDPALLPAFDEGSLILGLSKIEGSQTLSFLFSMSGQMPDPATSNTAHIPPDPEIPAGEKYPDICWSYLSDNRWVFLKPSELLSDGTGQFQHTGIISLKIPSFSGKNNSILSPDKKWIRASARKNSSAVARTLAIYPHSLTAVWQDNENTAAHLRTPLPAFTIDQAAAEDLGDIGEIIQPLESFGGRPAETHDEGIIRTGERLSHRQRAILPRDYERLVLQQFPEIWKVKCLPHHTEQRSDKAGHVLIVPVQGPDSINELRPQTPIATQALLTGIRGYLQKLVSPFVKLEVCNPVYVKIKVACTVQFTQDADAGKCLDLLDQELVRYLSPWFYDKEREAKAGYYTSLAEISGFIQSRPYIAFLDAIQLSYDPAPGLLTTDWYFLTSAGKHEVREAVERICEQ